MKESAVTRRNRLFSRWITKKPDQMLWLIDLLNAHRQIGTNYRFNWYWENMLVHFGVDCPDFFIDLAKAHIKKYYPYLKKQIK